MELRHECIQLNDSSNLTEKTKKNTRKKIGVKSSFELSAVVRVLML